MARQSVRTVDEYELALSETLSSWPRDRRTAFAAAMADRWYSAYRTFSEANDWGDPAAFKAIVDATWRAATGTPLSPGDARRAERTLHEITPHLDDFDGPFALAAIGASAIAQDAVRCTQVADNTTYAVRAALSGFEAAVPDWVYDPDDHPKLWKGLAARREAKAQRAVLDAVAKFGILDDAAAASFRIRLTEPEFVGEPSPAADPPLPPGVTNAAAFDQYRRVIETDLRTEPQLDIPGVPYAMLRLAAWGARYSRRRQFLTGEYGRLADAVGVAASVARQRALNLGVNDVPPWDGDSAGVIEMCLSNPMRPYGVTSPLDPHDHGPSIRRLWAEGKRDGRGDAEAWAHVVAWARHEPAAWAEDARRRKKGKAQVSDELSDRLGRSLTWASTGDPFEPWATVCDGGTWRVRVNDFPDDFLYSLTVEGRDVGPFHEWPVAWGR
jgi:hypothetical protein